VARRRYLRRLLFSDDHASFFQRAYLDYHPRSLNPAVMLRSESSTGYNFESQELNVTHLGPRFLFCLLLGSRCAETFLAWTVHLNILLQLSGNHCLEDCRLTPFQSSSATCPSSVAFAILALSKSSRSAYPSRYFSRSSSMESFRL
jgi:hypothetical protein